MRNYLDYDVLPLRDDETDQILRAPLISRLARWAGAAVLVVAAGLAIWTLLVQQRNAAYALIDGAAAPRQASWGLIVVVAVGGVLMLMTAGLLRRYCRPSASRS